MKHVVIAIIKKQNPLSYLLVSSKKDHGQYSGYYYPPGGHIEAGESEVEALKREINEELQMEVIKASKLTDTLADVKDQKTSWYLCEVSDQTFVMNQEELLDVNYFTQKEIQDLNVWPATLAVLEEFIFEG